VVAAKSGRDAVDFLEAIDHPRLREAARREPAADEGKALHHNQDGDADHRQPDQGAFIGQCR